MVIIAAVAFVAVLSVGFLANQVAINKAFTPQTVKLLLEKYLPSEIWDNLPDFSEESLDNGSILYRWSGSDDESFAHKIELIVENDEVQFYLYRPYLFGPEFQKGRLSMEQASDLVKEFAKDFIVKGEELIFVNRPAYYRLYDPDNVESWVAERDGIEYNVMVHLNDMGVIFFMASPMAPEDITAEDVHLPPEETFDLGDLVYIVRAFFPNGEMIRYAVSEDGEMIQ